MKRGSALLIVLGMLSFIVVSAVAFSAYMRYARMPSSYLRRTSSSRLLAKAALAEAITFIDTSVGNDRYPGFKGNVDKEYARIDDKSNRNVVDYWVDRFYIGTNQLVSPAATVSTLCTEALAYIPPPLINEARYYSRRSIAATWHTMGFDSGRFAFTAIDVSDYFDVNRVCATPLDATGSHMYGRNSSDCGRVTLAHVFENTGHTGYIQKCDPDKWDAFMDNYLDDGKVPLVSVADLNLAMNKQGLDAAMSPFCNFIRNRQPFVTDDTGADAQLVRNMTFVTDSWYAPTNRASDALDISRRSDQPFYGHESGATLMQIINDINGRFWNATGVKNSPFFNQTEVVQLYDYLDEDSIPSSLALPTVERTPMITGLSIRDGSELKVVVEGPNTYEKLADQGNTKYEVKTWTLKVIGRLEVNAGAVYPFKYDHGVSKSYKAEAAATIALAPLCEPEHTGLLRDSNAAAPGIVTLQNGRDWPGDLGASWAVASYDGGKPSVVRCRSASKPLSVPSSVKTDSEAMLEDVQLKFADLDVAFTTKMPESESYNEDECSFRMCKKKVKQMVNGTETWVDDTTFQDQPIVDRIGFQPARENLSGAVAAADLASGTYAPTVQVWVRVFTGSDTVDLVPACWRDDRTPCDIVGSDAKAASNYPMIRFRSSNPEAIGVKLATGANEELTGGGMMDIYPPVYMAEDPRFNFAPEDFTIGAIAGDFKTEWLNRAREHSRAFDNLERDGDIFMATSDAGYLQSAYELSYILKVSDGGSDFGVLNRNEYDGNAGRLPSKRVMWRTYSEYDSGSSFGDIDRLDIINGSQGFRVNPYTQSKGIMMSALANTPLDWWAASTNDTVNTKVHNSSSLAGKYSFSEWSGAKVQLKYRNLEQIADNLMAKFRDTGSSADWREAFDDFDWDAGGTDDGNGDRLCGVQLENNVKLHSVDRKFLHGFWKECFANRQQLFLIFVRAEPMMMGGGGLGQTPPQLGARAVALVWRDPTETKVDVNGDGGTQQRPHRTRVLFYRQFD